MEDCGRIVRDGHVHTEALHTLVVSLDRPASMDVITVESNVFK